MSDIKQKYFDYISMIKSEPFKDRAIELAKLRDNSTRGNEVLEKIYRVEDYGLDQIKVVWEDAKSFHGGYIEIPVFWLWFDDVERYIALIVEVENVSEKYAIKSEAFKSKKSKKPKVTQQELDTLNLNLLVDTCELEAMEAYYEINQPNRHGEVL